jgi:Protein of unknown function (DUF1566)
MKISVAFGAAAALWVFVGSSWANPVPTFKTRLNDTGARRCLDDQNQWTKACAATGQDGEFGRDVRLPQGDDGRLGFRFVKVCQSGQAAGEGNCPADPPFGAGVNDWACTQDRVTGLIWELKTDDGGPRDQHRRYAFSGVPYEQAVSSMIDATNAQGLCGAADWAVPSEQQLLSLVDLGDRVVAPKIDSRFFPNTPAVPFSSYVSILGITQDEKWRVNFVDGTMDRLPQTLAQHLVRLVRQASSPGGERFTRSLDGAEIFDLWTGLAWRLCYEGEVRNSNVNPPSCEGDARVMGWKQALAIARSAGGGWRLPSYKELDSVFDRESNLSVNFTPFPFDSAFQAAPTWTSTPVTLSSGDAPAAVQIEGYSSAPVFSKLPANGVVRLVRDTN